LGKHLDETRAHSERLKQIFDRLGETPTGQLCKATQGLVGEAREMILAKVDDAVRDAGLIACAQRIEHYEIAGYGCAHTFAKALGEEAAAGLLGQTLNEEAAADERFTSLAEQVVNPVPSSYFN
jgi:ferritin-like metal-binding protein YciE